MKHNLPISVSDKPQPNGMVSYKSITLRERFMRMLFGKEDWERHKQREMKALAEETVRRVTRETEKRVRKALEQQMAEEIERRVQLELERRTTINIIQIFPDKSIP